MGIGQLIFFFTLMVIAGFLISEYGKLCLPCAARKAKWFGGDFNNIVQ